MSATLKIYGYGYIIRPREVIHQIISRFMSGVVYRLLRQFIFKAKSSWMYYFQFRKIELSGLFLLVS